MKQEIVKKVKELFREGKIEALVGPRQIGEHVGPHVFTSPGELGTLVTGDEAAPGAARYSLFRLLEDLQRRYPTKSFGLLVRGCEERALAARLADGRVATLNPRRIVLVGFSCPSELAEACQCSKPWPDALAAGDKIPGVEPDLVSRAELMRELTEWLAISDRCVKCFGCRNACPVCGCKECTVEREVLVPQRQLPPSDSFLMTRAVHMVDRCVSCGLCERACPSGIPLRRLYRLVSRLVGQRGRLYEPEPQIGDQEREFGTRA